MPPDLGALFNSLLEVPWSDSIPDVVLMEDLTIGFLGGGKMAEALVGAFLTGNRVSADRVVVGDKIAERRTLLESRFGIRTTDNNAAVVTSSPVVFIARHSAILSPTTTRSADTQFRSHSRANRR